MSTISRKRKTSSSVQSSKEISSQNHVDSQVIVNHVLTRSFTHPMANEDSFTDSEGRFRMLTMNAPVGIFQTDKEGNCIFVNKRWCQIAGMTAKEAMEQGWVKALHPDDKERVFTEWYAAAMEGKEFLGEYRFKTKRGKVTWLRGSAVALEGASGQTLGYIGTIVDITAKKMIEEQALETSHLLTTILNTAPIGFCLFDKGLRYQMINTMLADINGIPPTDHIGKTIQEIIPSINNEVTKQLKTVLKTGKPILGLELTGETKSEPGILKHWVEDYFPVHSLGGEIVGIGALVLDVTQAKRNNERQEFLEKVSTKLAASFEDTITLQEIAKLIVPYLADYSRIAIVNKDNEIQEITVTHFDHTRVTLATNLFEHYKNRPETTHGIQKILETGKSEILPTIDQSILNTIKHNKKLLKTIKEIGLKSYMGVPLVARGKVIGAMTFSSVQESRYYTSEDLKFAEELAQRIALALDNSRLYQEAQEEIKERQRFEESLLKSREQYKRLIDLSPMPMAVHVAGKIVYTNQAAARLIGAKNTDELIGKNVMRFVHPDYHDVVKKRVEKIYKKKLQYTDILEEKFIRLDGEVIDVEIASLLLEYEGKPAIQVIIRDITESKRLERQKDEFLGIASHELKTPVTSLKAFGQVIQRLLESRGDEKSVLLLQKMDTQINKLTNLIGDLLDISKIEGGRLQFHNDTFVFDDLLDEVIEEIQRTTDKHMLVKKGKTGKKINGDRDRIGQVIINFLTNAIKYSPDSKDIIIHSSVDKKELTLCVQDFGVGIPQDNLDHVFERFYRVSGKSHDTVPGMGLGLFIAAEIIKRQGGRIWAESKQGTRLPAGRQGSKFCFTLPLMTRRRVN